MNIDYKCPYCGLDPFEYIDGQPIAMNCCEAYTLRYERNVARDQLAIVTEQRDTLRYSESDILAEGDALKFQNTVLRTGYTALVDALDDIRGRKDATYRIIEIAESALRLHAPEKLRDV